MIWFVFVFCLRLSTVSYSRFIWSMLGNNNQNQNYIVSRFPLTRSLTHLLPHTHTLQFQHKYSTTKEAIALKKRKTKNIHMTNKNSHNAKTRRERMKKKKREINRRPNCAQPHMHFIYALEKVFTLDTIKMHRHRLLFVSFQWRQQQYQTHTLRTHIEKSFAAQTFNRNEYAENEEKAGRTKKERKDVGKKRMS